MADRKTAPSIIIPLLLVAASLVIGVLLLQGDDEMAGSFASSAEADDAPRASPPEAAPSSLGDLSAVRRLRIEGITSLRLSLDTPPPAGGQLPALARTAVRLSEDGRELTITGPDRARLFGKSETPHLALALPALETLDIDGASTLRLSGPVEELHVLIDGAADVTLSGPRCGALVLRVDGAAVVDAASLPCARVSVEVDGAARVTAFASESADVGLDGIGSITVRGNPRDVRVEKDGLGRIRFPDRSGS